MKSEMNAATVRKISVGSCNASNMSFQRGSCGSGSTLLMPNSSLRSLISCSLTPSSALTLRPLKHTHTHTASEKERCGTHNIQTHTQQAKQPRTSSARGRNIENTFYVKRTHFMFCVFVAHTHHRLTPSTNIRQHCLRPRDRERESGRSSERELSESEREIGARGYAARGEAHSRRPFIIRHIEIIFCKREHILLEGRLTREGP